MSRQLIKLESSKDLTLNYLKEEFFKQTHPDNYAKLGLKGLTKEDVVNRFYTFYQFKNKTVIYVEFITESEKLYQEEGYIAVFKSYNILAFRDDVDEMSLNSPTTKGSNVKYIELCLKSVVTIELKDLFRFGLFNEYNVGDVISKEDFVKSLLVRGWDLVSIHNHGHYFPSYCFKKL